MLIRALTRRVNSVNYFGLIEILSRLVNWSYLPIVAFLVSASSYGDIVLYFTYITLVMSLGALGQNRTILKFGNDEELFYHSMFISLLSTLMICLFVIFVLGLSFVLLPISVLLVFMNNICTRLRLINGVRDFGFIKVLHPVMKLVFFITGLFIFDIEPLYLYMLTEMLASIFVSLYILFKLKVNIYKLDGRCFRKTLSFGFPVFVQTVFSLMVQYGDKIYVSERFGNVILADYYFVSVFCSGVGFIFAYYSQKYEVKIYQANSFDTALNATKAFLYRSLSSGILFFPVSLLAYYFSTKVSNEYQFNLYLMVLYYICSLILVLSTSFYYLVAYLDMNKYIIYYSVLLAAMYYLFVFCFVDSIGIYAMPIASIASTLLIVISMLTFVFKKKNSLLC
ncbi:hypothetical protein CAY59_15960 [Vibrio campbellii]|uniref:lipopolysaccharide biosynthesis protein n=1 Tax=Vibrio campbellii TaxID=680 RepID=UPI000A300970|nr:oligosaccharide flippase family protein [Vibrio campbellii]ARR45715.1 hypothetical protein CAY59_15960 [Vibrio campbellii]